VATRRQHPVHEPGRVEHRRSQLLAHRIGHPIDDRGERDGRTQRRIRPRRVDPVTRVRGAGDGFDRPSRRTRRVGAENKASARRPAAALGRGQMNAAWRIGMPEADADALYAETRPLAERTTPPRGAAPSAAAARDPPPSPAPPSRAGRDITLLACCHAEAPDRGVHCRGVTAPARSRGNPKRRRT
jgi:hypothetical protein